MSTGDGAANQSMYQLRREAMMRGIDIPRWVTKEKLFDLIAEDKIRKGERAEILQSGPVHYLLLDTSSTPVDVVVVSMNKEEFLIRAKEELGLGKDAKLRIPQIIGTFQIIKYPHDRKSSSPARAGQRAGQPSDELLDLREEWLQGTITNKEIQSIITRNYPDTAKYDGSLISDIFKDIINELSKYGVEDLHELGYTDPTNLILLYDLKEDELIYYPYKEEVLDRVKSSDHLVRLETF